MLNETNTDLSQVPTSDLVDKALHEARELIRVEVLLARDEVREEVRALKGSAVTFMIAFGLGVAGFSTMLSVLLVASGAPLWVAITVAMAVLLAAGILALIGRNLLPKSVLKRTRERVEGDVRRIKEHVV